MALTLLQSACYVEDGQLNYILSIAVDNIAGAQLTGNELIIHNGAVYDISGGVGIPTLEETNYYGIYPK